MRRNVSDSTYNLLELSERLFAEDRLLPLANSIRRARDLHSLSIDLDMALESLDALNNLLTLHNATEETEHSITESALLSNALILYARATKTTSTERGGFDLRSRFTNEQMVVHRELCDLRDQAIAHFGSGGSHSGEWQAELIVLHFRGGTIKPGAITRRKLLDRKLAQRARKQISEALTLMRALTLEKLDELTNELNKCASADPIFFEEINRHPLNLDIFLTSPDAGEIARSSFDLGHAKSSVRHA